MSGRPAPLPERIWIVYVLAVLGVAWGVPGAVRTGAELAWHTVVHGLVLAAAVAVARRCSHDGARWWRAAMAIGGLPLVFSAKCWILPHAHPEPFEYAWLALDRALLGGDAATLAEPWLGRGAVELLQVVYAGFYVVPVVAVLAAGRRAGAAAFDRALTIVVGCFLLSYLGYLLVPTVGPKVALAFERELEGLWLFPWLRSSIDGAEANPWNCFPSGHTMLTLVSLVILWRWHRPLFWWLVVPCSLLVASTVLLRYHWTIDVVVGAALVWPAVRGVDALLDRDGWPPAASAAAGGPVAARGSDGAA